MFRHCVLKDNDLGL